MQAFLELVAERKVHLKPLITHRFPIEQAESAYALMMEGSTPYIAMVITYPSDRAHPLPRTIAVGTARTARPVTLGIIGAGNHVRDMLLPPLQTMRMSAFAASVPPRVSPRKPWPTKLTAAYCTSDSQAILDDAAINTVLIGTRHDSHAALTVQALRAGKHVFVEKPLCLTEEELQDIRSTYEKQAAEGLHLMVGFNRRFSPHAKEARTFFSSRSNPLVMLYRINAGRIPADHWVQDPDVGGGRVIGEVCHFVDYMQALCAAPPASVFACRIGRHSSGITDDQCSISLTFGDGSIGTIIYTAEGSSELPKERFEAHADGKSLVMATSWKRGPTRTARARCSRPRSGTRDLRKKWRSLYRLSNGDCLRSSRSNRSTPSPRLAGSTKFVLRRCVPALAMSLQCDQPVGGRARRLRRLLRTLSVWV
jgi:predicted dehydrogenase